jgi:peroxiredoxin
MLHRLLHPSARTLSDFVDGELARDRAVRVARHVAACERCRAFVWSCRRIDAAAAGIVTPALSPQLREHVLARRAAGDDVILPAADERSVRRASPRYARVAVIAAALAVSAAVGMLLIGAPSLAADGSELRITPEAPRAGDTIRVEYRATSRFRGHDALRLRVRHARVGAVMDANDYTALTTLARTQRGAYTGSFVLPVGVTYVVLAVEDEAVSDVDHNGERWEIVLHGDDGRPLHDALNMQIRDVRFRNRILAAQIADSMLRLYPLSVQAHLNRLSLQAELLDGPEADTLRAVLRDSLPALLAAQPHVLDDRALSTVIFYAGHVRDTAVVQAYRQRLIAQFPLSPAAQQQRVFEVGRTWGRDTTAFWNALDRLWQETAGRPRHGQIAFTAWQSAQQWGDHAALALWGRRMIEQDPGNRSWIGQAFAGIPALREEGVRMLQQAVAAMDSDAVQRPLTHSAAEFNTLRLRARGRMLVDMGTAMLALGRQAEGEAALAEAVDLAWQPSLFRAVADARLRGGDTIAALQLLARVAVDPATPAAFADTVRARAGSHAAVADWDAQWRTWRQEALEEMQRHTMYLASNRPVRGRPRVRTPDGAAYTLDAANGELTFVAFWSRYCTPSVVQMRQLAQLGRTLQQQGVRVVTLTEERPTESLAAFLGAQDFDLPVLHDTDLEARRAFDSFATPVYLVIDGSGTVRFQGHGLEDVLRQVHLLRNGAGVE